VSYARFDQKWNDSFYESMRDLRARLGEVLEDTENTDIACVETDSAFELRLFHMLNKYLADDAYNAAPADFDRHIVIYGNPSQGFQVAGPFVDWDAAQDFAGGFDDTEWWVNKLAEIA